MYLTYGIYTFIYYLYAYFFYYIIKNPVECCARRVEEDTDGGAAIETEKYKQA